MADKSDQLVLDALSRAAAGGAPLHSSRSAAGLFPATAAGRRAAGRCREEGYLTLLPGPAPVDAGTSSKAPPETWGLSEKGLAYMLGQVSPRKVLDDLVRVLEARAAQLDGLVAEARQAREQLTTLRSNAEAVLRQLMPLEAGNGAPGGLNAMFQAFLQRRAEEAQPPVAGGGVLEIPAEHGDPAGDPGAAILRHLAEWQRSGASEDCPLPDLYRHACARAPGLTIGRFHDCLRRLRDADRIYLHPWTGPLYDLPEPLCALLTGHEVAYYASLRAPEGDARAGHG